MKPVRVSVKAVIIRNSKLLLTTNADPDGFFYLLPGGGQHPGETVPEALVRECREEIGVEVEVGRLLFVRDYIGQHHEFAASQADVHQVELMFECTLVEGQAPHNGSEPDKHQVSVEWIGIEHLDRVRLYPAVLRPLLQSGRWDTAVYLGDVN